MNWFRNLPIARKLAMAFTITVVLTLALALCGLASTPLKRLLNKPPTLLPGAKLLSKMQKALTSLWPVATLQSFL